MVLVAVSPGERVPQATLVRLFVQPHSWYTPKSTELMTPDDDTDWFMLSKPAVVTVKNIAVDASAIIAPAESFGIATFFPLTV